MLHFELLIWKVQKMIFSLVTQNKSLSKIYLCNVWFVLSWFSCFSVKKLVFLTPSFADFHKFLENRSTDMLARLSLTGLFLHYKMLLAKLCQVTEHSRNGSCGWCMHTLEHEYMCTHKLSMCTLRLEPVQTSVDKPMLVLHCTMWHLILNFKIERFNRWFCYWKHANK